ncbi:hypothetical protein KAF25_007676 [Fusarium avenaceum]|uniref:Uncharacterized protein n=1 Tax=Fusarium avenaceum TaxID=40199 RepID=A0A9P7KPB8_9HYPO|nr:hypothetical protein KAF25_007676 [Fusarium avenaceum]
MPSHTTTSLLLPSCSGNFVAEVIGANPTATTFVLDCDFEKTEEDCYVTQRTVIVGPWADKSLAPGAANTWIYKESFAVEEEGYSYSVQCDMSRTYDKTCTTINVGATEAGRNDDGSRMATFPRSTDTSFDIFHYAAGYGAFNWVPVTVTGGHEHLLAARTASSAETMATSDASRTVQAAKAIVADAETASTVDDDLFTITGEASPTINTNDDDLVTITGEATSATSTVDEDVVTITGEAAPTKTSGSAPCMTRASSMWAAVVLAAFVALF